MLLVFSCEFSHESVYLFIADLDAFSLEDAHDAGAKVLTFFRREKDGGSAAYECTTEKCVKYVECFHYSSVC